MTELPAEAMESVDLATFWDLFGPAVIAALVAALLCGFLGFFVATRRIAFVSSALGQVSGLGVSLGYYLGSLWGVDPHGDVPLWLDPVVMALVVTGAAAAGLAFTSRSQRVPPESPVAVSYLLATALAIIVLASPRMAQESHEISMLLFGNAVAVAPEHLLELIAVAVVVGVSQLFLFNDVVFVSFDREMAQSLGLPVRALDLYLHLSIGVSVAVATRAIGALPVFGFLVLPAGAALLLSRSVARVVIISVVTAVVAALGGFYLSFVESWPTGPVMVMCAAVLWPVAAVARGFVWFQSSRRRTA
ncbi:MAG: metal ABC transporter permease [Myxococcaceae bacterium]